MFSHKGVIILTIILILICIFTFSIIYQINKDYHESYEDAFYTSIQIQTSIGMSNASDRTSIRNWITAQSILAYILNIILVIYLSGFLIKI
jgi:hypothetical protein